MTGSWEISRTIDEVEKMADLLNDTSSSEHPSWYGGTSIIFGSDTTWPLMVHVAKFIKEGEKPDPLTAEKVLEHLQGRVEFLIEKADNERGLSAPKARDQVNMLLWLFDREDLMIPQDAGFKSTSKLARQVQEAMPS